MLMQIDGCRERERVREREREREIEGGVLFEICAMTVFPSKLTSVGSVAKNYRIVRAVLQY